MRKFPLLFLSFLSIIVLGGAQLKEIRKATKVKRPKNIILLIGDGMGLSQITAGMYANGNKIALERFKYIGLSKTHSGDNLITDSAAGATAFSCGKKTYNKAIAVDMNKNPMKTILEEAESRGLFTGVVATSEITDATPASFYAHQPYREMEEEIALDALKVDMEVFSGGGRKFFTSRKDGRNLEKEFAAKGYTVATSAEEAEKSVSKWVYLAAEEGMPKISEGRGDFLSRMTKKAIETLSKSPRGFFLMSEGSQIDWGGHANDSKYIINEMLDFSKTIDIAMDFAEKDGETLVIVTADHETGGYGLTEGNLMFENIGGKFIWTKHTFSMVPVFAYGPGSEDFTGIMENTAIHSKMLNALGWN
jgi:alkaline phosphatase